VRGRGEDEEMTSLALAVVGRGGALLWRETRGVLVEDDAWNREWEDGKMLIDSTLHDSRSTLL
jgi:hypothetical protein